MRKGRLALHSSQACESLAEYKQRRPLQTKQRTPSYHTLLQKYSQFGLKRLISQYQTKLSQPWFDGCKENISRQNLNQLITLKLIYPNTTQL
jgi:hypothetical protein